VDDDALVRAALRMMLSGSDEVEVAGEADDGSQVLAAVRETRPAPRDRQPAESTAV